MFGVDNVVFFRLKVKYYSVCYPARPALGCVMTSYVSVTSRSTLYCQCYQLILFLSQGYQQYTLLIAVLPGKTLVCQSYQLIHLLCRCYEHYTLMSVVPAETLPSVSVTS